MSKREDENPYSKERSPLDGDILQRVFGMLWRGLRFKKKWRNEGVGASFTEKETSYVEKKYLCDEAIKKIHDGW